MLILEQNRNIPDAVGTEHIQAIDDVLNGIKVGYRRAYVCMSHVRYRQPVLLLRLPPSFLQIGVLPDDQAPIRKK